MKQLQHAPSAEWQTAYVSRINNHKTRFIASGIVNTLVDLAVFNLVSVRLRWPIIAANLLSTSIALMVGYILNKTFVFRHKNSSWRHAGLFVACSLFSIWVVQTGTIYGAYHLLRHVGMPQWVTRNLAKGLAVMAGACCNYFMYKEIVFVDKPAKVVGV